MFTIVDIIRLSSPGEHFVRLSLSPASLLSPYLTAATDYQA